MIGGYVLADDAGALATARAPGVLDDLADGIYADRACAMRWIADEALWQALTLAAHERDQRAYTGNAAVPARAPGMRRTKVDEQMAAFDRLPAAVRAAFAEARFDWTPVSAAELLEMGYSAAAIIRSIHEIDHRCAGGDGMVR